MVRVIAWPPLAAVARETTPIYPVSRSRSMLTGKRYVSAARRVRREMTISVQGLGTDRAGAGWLDLLRREIKGGLDLVRIDIAAPVWHQALRPLNGLRGQFPVIWRNAAGPVAWNNDDGAVTWLAGTPITATAVAAGGLSCPGLPASRVVAYPSELVRVVDAEGAAHVARVMGVAHSDADGTAVIYTDTALPSGTAIIGWRESAVFDVVNINEARSPQPVNANWYFDLTLVEVFEDETDGFVEVDPWH